MPCGYIFRCLIEFASFICVCVIVGLSKSDPFDDHIIGNLTTYFNDVIDTNSTNPVSNLVISNQSNLMLEKQNKSLLNESYNDLLSDDNDDDDADIEKIKVVEKLRRLVSESFCLEIRENFEKFKGKKLSTIFDLKYSKVHKFAIAEMVISCVMFLFMFIAGYAKENNNFFVWFSCIAITLMIPRFVLSFFLFYYLEKSDIERYDDFLDCKNVRSKAFKNISDISTLRNCFYTFVVFNVIILGIEKIERLVDYGKETAENVQNHSSTRI